MRGGMGLFHVYVEAPDRAPETITRLAETIGKKYGVPVADLEKRLTAGRFRVKANVDRETADVYAKALGEHGAVVRIEDAVATPAAGTPIERGGSTTPPANSPARTPSPSLPPRNASSSLPPRNAGTSLPPPNVARTGTSSLPPTTKPAPVVASGLAAAYTASSETDLGALSTDSISLASLDGKDAVGDEAFAPPVDLSPAIAPAPAAAAPGKKAKPKDDPVDLFAPPDAAEDAAFQVELAADEIEHRAKKMSTPPVGVPVQTPVAPGMSTPSLSPRKKPITPAVGAAPVTVSADAQEAPRWRFAAGVLLAIILGFVPAHLVASAREKSAFARIDEEVIAQQSAADSSDLYEALDGFRKAKQSQKQSEKRNIALLSMLIWGVTAGGLAYVWFRRVPWDRPGRS